MATKVKEDTGFEDEEDDVVEADEAVIGEVVPVEVDYTKMSMDELLEAIGAAYAAKNMKLMGTLSKLYTKAEAVAEKAKKDALLTELVNVTGKTLAIFTCLANVLTGEAEQVDLDTMVEDFLMSDTTLDGAEGIWFAFDFGEQRNKGINPACKLIKGGQRKAAADGSTSTAKSSYVAGLPSSADMLKEVGDVVYLDKDTNVTIDKVDVVLAAGTTYSQAYNYSTNGGWRNRVRMALGKATSRI